MRIAYHPNSSTLRPDQLKTWLAAAALNIDAVPAPGVVLEITDPNYPFSFENSVVADDRITQGGASYAVVRYSARSGQWDYSNIHSAEVDSWRDWYSATQGMRLPFIAEIGAANYRAVAPGAFPLTLVKLERWAGQLNVQEALAWK